ncbi:MAG TPA: flavodoxin domain-containing protein [Methanoregulaceae archaeon]|nr:flavodoxin domain-containing protein [Methanoregulaceae archaeon]
MPARILVAYATRKGSTAEIAQAIGKELQSAGHSVDVAEMKMVTSLEGYDAIVIGAPFYMGKIIDVKKFVSQHQEKLTTLPIAAFTVGVAPAADNPKMVEDSMKALHTSLDPLQPVASTMFGGKLDPDKLSFIQRKMIDIMKVPKGDFRDWDAISEWTRDVAGKLGV